MIGPKQQQFFKNHLQTLKAGSSAATSVAEMSRWITDNTFRSGRKFSYRYHEYQPRILDSTAREIVVRKCSQVGISELSVRRSLGLVGMLKDFTVIYTLPTATFASVMAKTRVNPVINESPYLNSILSGTDSVEVKQFDNGSFLYLKGAASSNAPISIPCDMLVHDELDFSDPLVISQYQSRLTHSQHKMKMKLSTPTLPGKGIDHEFQRSRRFFNFVKCNHCNHQFIPHYYDHVRIPGYKGDLIDITKKTIHRVNCEDAYVACPNCGKAPDLGPKHREWVCENPGENHVAEGFQVSPFDAPAIITPSYLVEASTAYTNIAEFVNFNLGLPFFSKESVLSPDEIRTTIIENEIQGTGYGVMGIDLGKTCHVTVAKCFVDGAMQVLHVEAVPLSRLKERYRFLRAKYRVRMSVMDSLPYTDMVLSLQAEDPNLWAVVYSASRGVHLYTIKERDRDTPTDGGQQQRQLNVSRDRTFDSLMEFMRSGEFSKLKCDLDDEFVLHCTDMRRIRDWNLRMQVMEFKWIKSEDRNDHLWFSTSYAYLAKFIIGTVTGEGGGALPLLSSFKVHPRPEHGRAA